MPHPPKLDLSTVKEESMNGDVSTVPKGSEIVFGTSKRDLSALAEV